LLAAATQKWRDYENREYEIAAKQAVAWLGEIAHSEIDFIKAIGILRAYSLVEEAEDLDCYSTHPVVHQWAFYMQDDSQRIALSYLAVVLVGIAVPSSDEKNFWETQTRLLSHAEQCGTCVITNGLAIQGLEWEDDEEEENKKMLLEAVLKLGVLYSKRDKLNKAEKMYMLVLGNKPKLSKQSNTYGLDAVCSLGDVYTRQKKYSEAKELLFEALEFQKRLFGENAWETLQTMKSIGILFREEGTLDKAEVMIMQALNGYKRTLEEDH
jgi:tetratricopeptide (TPR) repeat protein